MKTGKTKRNKIEQLIEDKKNDIIDLAKIGCSQTLIARVVLERSNIVFDDYPKAREYFQLGLSQGCRTMRQRHYEIAMSNDKDRWFALEKWLRQYGDRPDHDFRGKTLPEKFQAMWEAYSRGEISDEAVKNISTALEKHVNVTKLSELDDMKKEFEQLKAEFDEYKNQFQGINPEHARRNKEDNKRS